MYIRKNFSSLEKIRGLKIRRLTPEEMSELEIFSGADNPVGIFSVHGTKLEAIVELDFFFNADTGNRFNND